MQNNRKSWTAAPVALQPAMLRSQVIAATHNFFRDQGFWEVTTPVFNSTVPAEMHLYPFQSVWSPQSGEQLLWLTTSPERGLKVMLARGLAPVFSIGKSMRNMEGASHKHNPEFLMLEWYRKNASFHTIMADVGEYVRFVTQNILGELPNEIVYGSLRILLATPWQEISLAEEFEKKLGWNLHDICHGNTLFEVAKEKGYYASNCTWNELFDQIVLNELEKDWPIAPFFLLDFPTRMSPLCTPQTEKPWLAQRFEFYIGGMELANGNTEYTNVAAVRQEFLRVHADRKKREMVSPPLDEVFLQSLERMNDAQYSGIGFGIDRLAMLLANVSDIRLVEPFAQQAMLIPPKD